MISVALVTVDEIEEENESNSTVSKSLRISAQPFFPDSRWKIQEVRDFEFKLQFLALFLHFWSLICSIASVSLVLVN